MKKGDDLENLGIHGRIIIKWIVTAVQWEGMDFIWLRIGTSGLLSTW
jgi:hypothetical protein